MIETRRAWPDLLYGCCQRVTAKLRKAQIPIVNHPARSRCLPDCVTAAVITDKQAKTSLSRGCRVNGP